ncbi:MAG: efflux RND transporter periplasmic adaptor subunit [Pseudomonadota bacterium]|nr:efflux RND transporter periplasmic adaptor subunit [Pseudomonadota bacterium]
MRSVRASLLAMAFLTLGGVSQAQEGEKPRPSVVVKTAVMRDVAQVRLYVGRVNAMATVRLVARVEGTLEKRSFTEGGFVKKGDLLFLIEQAAYKAAVAQSQADVAAMNAQLKKAEIDYSRDKGLAATKDIAGTELDAATASRDVAQANADKSKAALSTANLNLSYTEIRSPIDGRISAASVDVGNLVSPSSGPLATIVSIDPIRVTFYVPEKDLLAARRAGLARGSDAGLTPTLLLSDGSKYAAAGKLDYLGTEIGQGTDTIEVRATFPNSDHLLIPGQFVQVSLRTDQARQGIVVPQVALQRDQTGSYVLVAGKDGKVARQTVKLGEQIGGEWVVTDGLKGGEDVIVQGIQKVYPGVMVNAVQARE